MTAILNSQYRQSSMEGGVLYVMFLAFIKLPNDISAGIMTICVRRSDSQS